ncbi:MAG: hypothetical protein J6U61_07080 [Lachnospiraceae bacterium]|nr:hypothetical protein [Lachnospiraceae bacterium]
MLKIKKALAILLALVMVLSLAACNKSGTDNKADDPAVTSGPATTAAPSNPSNPSPSAPRTKDIYIGTWWVQHYDSADDELEDSGDWSVNQDKEGDDEATKAANKVNRDQLEARFANVKTIENRYGLKFYWTNLTYAGVKESINTSILAGSPDCDIYLTDAGMAIPAQMNGLCTDLKTILPADHDLFTDQTVMTYLDLGDGRACILRRQGGMNNTHPLSFNMQLLEEYNLEDPRDLWNRGEWTWDKFNEYMQVLTQDTDGDGQIDQYGFCGWDSDLFEELMLSNGANIAATPTEGLSSPAMGEVLQQVYDMYNVYNVCVPVSYEEDANDVRTRYRNGNIGFWMGDVWISQTNGSDYDWDGTLGYTLPFDIAYCHWPVGPSGNKDTDPQLNDVGGELYIIPAGVEDPLTVYNVLYDMWNWYELDTVKRDDPATFNWWINATGKTDEMRQANWKIQQEIMAKTTVDLWNSIGVNYDLWSLMNGTVTPAQFQEMHKQEVQDALDATFGK